MIYIAICDDCKQDMLHLKRLITNIMNKYSVHYKIVEFESGEMLLETPLTFHLIFLDIKMNGRSGIEIGKQIYLRNHQTTIIFQTNYTGYSKEAINKAHAFSYLEKPIKKSLLEEQIMEFMDDKKNKCDLNVCFKNVRSVVGDREINEAVKYIPVRSILYFEYIKLKKEIRIVTDKGDYFYPGTMFSIEEKMQTFGFETSCRGILINLEKISRIKGYTVILNNGEKLPLSQRRVSKFKERINEHLHSSL